MKPQGNPTLPTGSVLIQPGQSLPQGTSLASLQPNGSNNMPSNLQIWTSTPSGAITVSGLAQPRGSTNLVTLPSGQTVLMTNLTTTANNPSIPLSVSSHLNKSQMQIPSGVTAGNPIVLSNSVSGQLNTTMNQGPISVALPTGLINNSNLNSFSSTTNAFVPNTIGSLSSDQSVHIAQLVDNQMQPNLTCFNPNANFQNLTPVNQIMLDSNNLNIATAQTQNKLTNISPIQHQIITTNPVPLSQQPQAFVATRKSNFTSDLVSSQPGIVISQATVASASNSPVDISKPVSSFTLTHIDAPASVAEPVSGTTSSFSSVPILTTKTENSFTPMSIGVDVINSSINTQAQADTKPLIDTMYNSVFTPASLGQLLTELDPHLQLDPEAEEVIANFASEFITSCAEKAQKLASHRGCSTVEPKDVLFCMERDWNIVVPGYVSEERPHRRAALSNVHKQRLALIKKQIKKM